MNYHDITKDDMLNGSGLRVVLWVAGCNHQCKNCQNPITWDPCDGLPFDNQAQNELVEALSPSYISGLTLSGGDPMFPNNRQSVLEICKYVKELYPAQNIWMYTGYLFEDIQDEPVLQYIDVLVDGEYIDSLRDIKMHWAGSTNQRIIDVQKTLAQGEVVLWTGSDCS